MSTIINKNNIKCAVFDLDGTLLNTLETIKYYLNTVLVAHGFSGITTEQCRSFVGDGAVKLVRRALAAVGADQSNFDSVFAEYNAAYNADPYYLTTCYEGVPEMLDALRQGGISLAVLSNKPDFATKAAIERFFPSTFSLVIGGREGKPLKPSPDSLYEIMDALSADPTTTAYVGDSEPDVIMAKNASVALGIFVSYGFRTAAQLAAAGAEIILSDPTAVSRLILN